MLPTFASDHEDAVADVVSTAFMQARQAAHLSRLKRMGGNTFREKVCKQDMRLPSGLILDVLYQTYNPAHLPQPAQRLATSADSSRTASRFGGLAFASWAAALLDSLNMPS
jgi:hypothetical protein